MQKAGSFPRTRLGLALLAAVLLGTSAQQSAPEVTYDGPITIRKGGTYRGNWRSLDPDKAAVTIDTREPVTIEDSNIQSRGILIYSAYRRANVTVRNTRGVALNPGRPVEEKRYPGRFLHLEEFESADVENNEMIGTSGMYLRKYLGDVDKDQTVQILRNKAINIDGRYSDGPDKFSDTGFYRAQFVQFNDVKDIAKAEIAWNEVINEPGKSRVEEIVNMYGSRGRASGRIAIHDNYLQGAYPVRPATDAYAGGGIMMGDGGSKTLEGAVGFIRAYRNQVISTSNQGIAIAAGHNIEVFQNRVISSGYLPDGSTIASQNVGIYLWDTDGNKRHGTFYNNVVRDNLVGWALPLRSPTAQNAMWFPDCAQTKAGKSRCTGNQVLPGPITLQTEKQEYKRWQDKLRGARVAVGLGSSR